MQGWRQKGCGDLLGYIQLQSFILPFFHLFILFIAWLIESEFSETSKDAHDDEYLNDQAEKVPKHTMPV